MEAELFGEESSGEEDESSEESDSEAAGEEQVGCVCALVFLNYAFAGSGPCGTEVWRGRDEGIGQFQFMERWKMHV